MDKEEIQKIVDFVMDLDVLTGIDTDEREHIETAVIEGFKAGEDKGKQEGFDEVVQFVIDNKMIPLCDYQTTGTIRQDAEHREDCRRCKWQAFLKGEK